MPDNTPPNTPAHLAATVWKKGDPSPNPGGRPKGLSSYIREKSLEGRNLVDFLFRVVSGEEQGFFKGTDRIKACIELLDRGLWPKTPTLMPQDPGSQALPILDVKSLTEEEIKSFEHFGLVLASIRQRLAGGTPEAQS